VTPTKVAVHQVPSLDVVTKPAKLKATPIATTSRTPVFQYKRDLAGVKEVLTTPPVHNARSESPFRDFGQLAEEYILSHGYDAPSNYQIHYAFEICDNSIEFADYLSQRGMAIMEAKWLWLLIIHTAS
jgi:hypothetical protein